MASFVITWKADQWPYEELMELVRAHSASSPARTEWRFRAYRRGAVGDIVYLLKQGRSPRGIFGRGKIVAAPRLKRDANGDEYGVALVEFDLLVDPFSTLLVSQVDTIDILPETVINTQSSGAPISEDVARALEEKVDEAASGLSNPVPDAERFAAALREMESAGRLSDDDRDMLVCHYNAPDFTLTGRQMSALMGWGGQSANRFYGGLGRRVSEQLGWVPSEREGYDGFYVSGLILGDRPTGAFEWTMRPQLVRALELLNWPGLEITHGGGTGDGIDAVVERGAYVWQRRLERDSRAAKLAKAHHGHQCQACTMTFAQTYGVIGEDFIEAHHLVPLSQIHLGEERAYTVDDFAVLCSNCHRMIHRWPDRLAPRPWDLEGFIRMLRARRN